MTKGTRVWTCDGCGKREPWRKGWGYFPGVESLANKLPGDLLLPLAHCSEACADTALQKAMAQ